MVARCSTRADILNQDNKDDWNDYLVGYRKPDETHTLPSGDTVRIWHPDPAAFFDLPPISMPGLTCITITDKEQRVKASIYIKDGVSRWLYGQQALLTLRNVDEVYFIKTRLKGAQTA